MYITIVRFASVLIVCDRTSQFVWLLIIINRLLLVYSAGSEGYHLNWLERVQANGMVLEEYNRAKKDPPMSPLQPIGLARLDYHLHSFNRIRQKCLSNQPQTPVIGLPPNQHHTVQNKTTKQPACVSLFNANSTGI